MKHVLLLILLISLATSLAATDMTGFRYGMVKQSVDDEDEITIVEDTTQLKIGDRVRLNVEFPNGDFFYAISYNANRASLMYSSHSQDNQAEADSIFTTLPWIEINDMNIQDRYVLMSSRTSQTKLVELFQQYQSVSGKVKDKFFRKIIAHLDDIRTGREYPEYKQMPVIRLERPVIGGVTFRGKMNFVLVEQSLTHSCSGEEVAVAEIHLKEPETGQ